MTNYVTNSALTTALSDYVLTATLTANYYTKTAVDSTFQTISNMSNYVTNSSLTTTLSNYALNSALANYVQSTYLVANYYTQTYINSTFATISSLSGYYPNTTTLNNIALPTANINANSQKIINVASPTQPYDCVNKSYADSLGTASLPTGTI